MNFKGSWQFWSQRCNHCSDGCNAHEESGTFKALHAISQRTSDCFAIRHVFMALCDWCCNPSFTCHANWCCVFTLITWFRLLCFGPCWIYFFIINDLVISIIDCGFFTSACVIRIWASATKFHYFHTSLKFAIALFFQACKCFLILMFYCQANW